MVTDTFKKNYALNKKEIKSKKTILSSQPIGLGIALTSRCGLKCIMCRAWEKVWDIPDKIADEIYSFLPYLSRLYWQGGEVFLSKHFRPLFKEAMNHPYLHQELVTSGLFIDQAWADLLTSTPINIIYSIDGFTPEVYEKIRLGARFEDMLKSASLINTWKEKNTDASARPLATTSINFTVMASNYKNIPMAVDFALSYGFDDLTLTPVDYIRDEENIFLHQNMDALKFIDEALIILREKAPAKGLSFHCLIPALKADLQGSYSEKGKIRPQKRSKDKLPLCLWPWQHMFVDIGGEVKPHCVCPQSLGNISDKSLEELWNSDTMVEYRRRVANGDMAGFCSQNCLANLHQEELFRIRDPLLK